MQYVLCFVSGVLVYRIEIKVVELVLVHVGEALLVDDGGCGRAPSLCIRTVAAGSCSSSASSVNSSATATTTDRSAVVRVGRRCAAVLVTVVASKPDRGGQRSGADDAAPVAVRTPERGRKLAKG